MKDLVHIFIKNGAEINARNLRGETPLHYAAVRGNGFNSLSSIFYKSLIFFFSGNVNIAQILIESGADVKAQDNNGKTPLDDAKVQLHFMHGNHSEYLVFHSFR